MDIDVLGVIYDIGSLRGVRLKKERGYCNILVLIFLCYWMLRVFLFLRVNEVTFFLF